MQDLFNTREEQLVNSDYTLVCSNDICPECNEYIYISKSYSEELTEKLEPLVEGIGNKSFMDIWRYAYEINPFAGPLYAYSKIVLKSKETDFYKVIVYGMKQLGMYKEYNENEEEIDMDTSVLKNMNNELDSIMDDLEFETSDEETDNSESPTEVYTENTSIATGSTTITEDIINDIDIELTESEDLVPQDFTESFNTTPSENTNTTSDDIDYEDMNYNEEEAKLIEQAHTFINNKEGNTTNIEHSNDDKEDILLQEEVDISTKLNEVDLDSNESIYDFKETAVENTNSQNETGYTINSIDALYPTESDDFLDSMNIDFNNDSKFNLGTMLEQPEIENGYTNSIDTDTEQITDADLDMLTQNSFEPSINVVQDTNTLIESEEYVLGDSITLEFVQECILNRDLMLEKAIEYNNRSLFKMIDKDMQNNIKRSIMSNLNKDNITELVTKRFVKFIKDGSSTYE